MEREETQETTSGVKAEKEMQEDKNAAELTEAREKYLRLYAEFENYKKRVQKDKEELARYGNESLLYELLTVMDNLEMALKHSGNSTTDSLVKGVEITLRELQRVMEKFGVTPIPALGKPFDPSLHHAMSQVEKPELEDQTVIEEMRKGYMLSDKVLRASLVGVSKKQTTTASEIISEETKEEQ